MNRILALLTASLIALSMVAFFRPSVQAGTFTPDFTIGGYQLIVGLDPQAPDSYPKLQAIVANHGCNITSIVSIGESVVAATVDIGTARIDSFVSAMHSTGIAAYTEPNLKAKAFLTPNDPSWQHQWGPMRIRADWAWNVTTGNRSVLVAIIDTGIDYTHPDLVANYVPLGYDWINNDEDPKDDYGHGTHCAGIIGAVLSNGIGIAGIAQVRIMAEKVLDDKGEGDFTQIVNGIIHATDRGAQIISMSFGTIYDSKLVHQAIRYACDHGVLLVAAAGNENTKVPEYPAAYEEVIAVAATDESDNRAVFSNYGNWIELSAPGVDIYSTMPTYAVTANNEGYSNDYDFASGTSMACPHVSGVAALVLSRYPNMTAADVRSQLRSTADDLGEAGFDEISGWGRINANRAVGNAEPQHDVCIEKWRKLSYILPGKPARFSVTVENLGSSSETSVKVQLKAYGIVMNETLTDVLPSGAKQVVQFSWTPSDQQGVFQISFCAVPVPGETVTQNNVATTTLTVRKPTTLKVPDDYCTIQSAIDAAISLDTIEVSPGIYYEHLLVNKPQVKIIGQDRDTTIIDGKGTGTCIRLLEELVTISGFTIQNSSRDEQCVLVFSSRNNFTGNRVTNQDEGDGVVIVYCSDNMIHDNIFTHCHSCGLLIYIASRNCISQSEITENPIGAVDWHSSEDTYYRNNVTFNTFMGLYGLYDSKREILANKIVSNGAWDTAGGGIVCHDGENGKVKDNLIEGNGYGIVLLRATEWKVHHNSFINNDLGNSDVYQSTATWSGRWNVTGNYWSDTDGASCNDYRVQTALYDKGGAHDQNPLMSPYLPSDVYHDGKVEIRDVRIISGAYGSSPDAARWNPHADLNEDGVIDIRDLSMAVANYGKTWKIYWKP